MVYNLKYHLTTIVAIFLALAIGILIGSSLIAGSSVKGLEGEFAKLRADNRLQRQNAENLSGEIKQHVEFERAVTPVLVDNLLWGRNVAIIQTGDYGQATQAAKKIIQQAGAKVVSVTTLRNMYNASTQKRMTHAIQGLSQQPADEADVGAIIMGLVANAIIRGTNPEVMSVLEDNGLLSTAGKYEGHVTHVVLVGGSKEALPKTSTVIDPVLIDKLKAAGALTLVGVEPYDAESSYIPVYHLKQIPTVDNVDQYMGQVGLVYAISGEAGDFGVKDTADRVGPEFTNNALHYRRRK